MKTRIAILSLVLGLFITATAFASEPVPATKNASKAVTEFLTNEISYPAFASENKIECYVLVSIVVNNDGTLDVDAANCKNCNMKDHVVKAIEESKNEKLAQYAGQNVLVKVNFSLLD
jgi:hypothetical protein